MAHSHACTLATGTEDFRLLVKMKSAKCRIHLP